MKFMFFEKKHKLHLSHTFCCNHTCYCVKMVSVTSALRYITSALRYHPLYQSRSSMYIPGLIAWNFTELAETVQIADKTCFLGFRRPIQSSQLHRLARKLNRNFIDCKVSKGAKIRNRYN